MRDGKITNRDQERIRELAAHGVSCRAIAAEIGCSPSTVSRHAPRLGRSSRDPDWKRGRQLILAAKHVPPGEREDLAIRFGYANLASFNVMLCRYRKRLQQSSSTHFKQASRETENARA